LTPRFSAERTVREYTEKYYLPAAAAYLERAAEKGAAGARLVRWERELKQNWPKLRFGETRIASDGGKHVFEVQVYLGSLDPEAVRVELYAEGADGDEPVRQEMARGSQLVGANGYTYSAQVTSTRPPSDYTARVIPHRPGVAVPLEQARICWQR